MTDYSELVKALRCENTGDDECGSSDCPYWSGLGCMDGQLMEDAAAAIEALQKDLSTLQKCYEIADTTVDEVLKQLPKRGEWIRVQEVDIPGEIRSVAVKCMCSMCRNEYLFPRIPQYCPDCGSMNTAKMEVQE